MPPKCPSSSREVIGDSFRGNARQYFWTGASRSSLPRSQSCKMAVAVIGLEMEPRRKSVDEVAGEKFSRSAMPNPADQAGSPSRTTATPIPGTLFADMKLETAFSISARFSGGRPFCCAERPAVAARKIIRERKAGMRSVFMSRATVFTESPRKGSLPQRVSAWNGSEGLRSVVRASTPCPAESVDPGVGGSLPWWDEPKAGNSGKRAAIFVRTAGLRGRGEEGHAGARSGAVAADHRAGSRGNSAPADRESAAPLLRAAAATGSGRQGISDQEGSGKIRFRGAELQSGPPGSGAQGF